MREPITPAEIRIGDKIRTESRDGRPFGTNPQMLASEWIAGEDDLDGDYEGVDLYLLERAKPAVDLPEKPTLGWIGTSVDESWLDRFHVEGAQVYRDEDIAFCDHPEVTAFTPAVAVPKAALDDMRNIGFFTTPETVRKRIDAFLAAVDAANGGDPR